MDKTSSYLVYEPPKSNSHGHGVRGKNLIDNVRKVVENFTETFDANAHKELEIRLSYDKAKELIQAENTIETLNKFIGPPTHHWDSAGHPFLKNQITWKTVDKNIFDILQFLDKIKADNISPLSNFSISYFYHYGDKDGPFGQMMCSIEEGRLFVRLHLIFPFTIDDSRTYESLTKFQQDLPFKINSKHFRRLGPSKNGYGRWKLDDNLQERVDACLK